jgi:hypothetical protein
MSTRKSYIIVGASVGLVAAGVAVYGLLRHPSLRYRIFGRIDPRSRKMHEDWIIDLNSEHSFPASDPPSFSPCTTR